MVDRKLRKKISIFVKELRHQGIRVSKVILYGSRATGRAHAYSDIDIAIVSPDFGKDRYRDGVRLFEIAAKIDPLIEPVPISIESYKKDTWIPLIYEIRTNGIELMRA